MKTKNQEDADERNTDFAIKQAAEHENLFFQIELDAEGKKIIHIDGYYYTVGEPGKECGIICPEKTWRHVSYSFYTESLNAVLKEGFAEWYMRTSERTTEYVSDCTLKKVHEDALRYFGGEPPTPICEQDLNIDIPCGGYVFATHEEMPNWTLLPRGTGPYQGSRSPGAFRYSKPQRKENTMSEYTAEEIAEAHDPDLTDGDGARALVDSNGNIVLQTAVLIEDEWSPVDEAWDIQSWWWDGNQWIAEDGPLLWGPQTHEEAMDEGLIIGIGNLDFDCRRCTVFEMSRKEVLHCGVDSPYFDYTTGKKLKAKEREGQRLPEEYSTWVSSARSI